MKSVLITGVSRGIGRATARHLAEQGWRVYGVDTEQPEDGDVLAGFWQGDVAEEALWSDTVVPGLQDADVRGLVNNAAIQSCNRIKDMTLQEWDRTIAVNLGAAFLATKHVAPLMHRGVGAMVNVSSVHALATSPGMAAYVASKGGLVAFTRAAALELAEWDIRVNAVLPGATNTNMLELSMQRGVGGVEMAKERLKAGTPLGRLGDPSEIASLIAFLLDGHKSAFITGQSFVADGGVLARLASE